MQSWRTVNRVHVRRCARVVLSILLSVLLLLMVFRGTSSIDTGATAALCGCVSDDDGPVAGARVRCVGCAESVSSDGEGRFEIPRPCAAVKTVAAWKAGYYVGGAPIGSGTINIRLRPYLLDDCEEYRWIAPWSDPAAEHNCENCHREIYEQWRQGGHSRAAINPRFLNLFDGTDQFGMTTVRWNLTTENPNGRGVCAACHAPSLMAGEAAAEDLRLVQDVPAQGVHCDFCHKVCDIRTDNQGLTHGRYAMQLLRPRNEPLFFGPLDDVVRQDTFSRVYRDSRYCASCHEGVMFGIHVYSTYSEWQQSPAARQGKQCQSCHMAPTGRVHNFALGHGGIERDPATLASHCDPAPRDEMLHRHIHVETSANSQRDGVRLSVIVSMMDVGHQMPTGYIDRQLILVVESFDSGGKSLRLRTGPVLPDIVGSLRGTAGYLFAKQPVGFDGVAPAPFWIARPDLLDTRLKPEQPQKSEFLFPLETRRFRVRLLYRRFWEEQTRIKRWPSTEIVVYDQTHDLAAVPRGSPSD